MHSNTLHAQARSVTLKHCNPYPCAVAPNAAAHRAQTRGLASRSAAARPQQRRTESTGHKQLAAALPRSQVEAVIPPTQQQQQQQPANARPVQFWEWPGQGKRKAHRIAYVTQGSGPVPVVLVHGMGACHEHFNKLLDELDGNRYTAYALDLLGFGDSDKPCPSDEASQQARGHLYNYNTWAQQLEDFVQQVVCQPAILVGNSAGGLTALQVAVSAPRMTRGLMLLDCSMRHMHEANQPPLLHPFIAAFQWLLLSTPVGKWAVQAVLSQPETLKSILQGAYGDTSSLSPELLASWRRHLQDATSCEVLLDVITNSTGPVPQDLLPLNTAPTVVVWGAADTWEPVDKAREMFSGWSADFVELPGVGHFPHDEVPALVAAMLDSFVDECAVDSEAAGSEAGAGQCSAGATVGGFTLRGLVAAAEVDSKI